MTGAGPPIRDPARFGNGCRSNGAVHAMGRGNSGAPPSQDYPLGVKRVTASDMIGRRGAGVLAVMRARTSSCLVFLDFLTAEGGGARTQPSDMPGAGGFAPFPTSARLLGPRPQYNNNGRHGETRREKHREPEGPTIFGGPGPQEEREQRNNGARRLARAQRRVLPTVRISGRRSRRKADKQGRPGKRCKLVGAARARGHQLQLPPRCGATRACEQRPNRERLGTPPAFEYPRKKITEKQERKCPRRRERPR